MEENEDAEIDDRLQMDNEDAEIDDRLQQEFHDDDPEAGEFFADVEEGEMPEMIPPAGVPDVGAKDLPPPASSAQEAAEPQGGFPDQEALGPEALEADMCLPARPKADAPSEEHAAPEGDMHVPAKPKQVQEIQRLDPDMAILVDNPGKTSVLVRAQKGMTDSESPQVGSLLNGALIMVLQQDGNRLNFAKLTGEGPDTGWVSIRKGDGTQMLCVSEKTLNQVEEEQLEEKRRLQEKQKEERRRRQNERQKSAEQMNNLINEVAEREQAAAQQQKLVEEAQEQAEKKARTQAEMAEEKRSRLQEEKDAEQVIAIEREARERLRIRLMQAAEAETLAIQDKERNEREQEEVKRIHERREANDSVWVFISPFGQIGRKYNPAMEQIAWRRIFCGPVQAAFIWDDMFFVAREDGKLAICDWGQPWMGGYEDWGPIFQGEVQAAFVHKDMLYVVKEEGRIATTAMGTEWDGSFQDWGSNIFRGSVRAAFVEGGKLYVVKDAKVASENWQRWDWDGRTEDWGQKMFPRSMKTAFVAEGNLYVARGR